VKSEESQKITENERIMMGDIYIQPRVLLAWERCDALEGKDDGNIHYPTRLASRPKYFIIQA